MFYECFKGFNNKEERNKAVMEALNDGYKQSEIARYLKISDSTVAKIKGKF